MAVVVIQQAFVDLLAALGLDAARATSITLRYDGRSQPSLEVTFLEDDPDRLGAMCEVLKSFTLVPTEEG